MNTITVDLGASTRGRRARSLLLGGIAAITMLAIADRRRETPIETVRVVTTTVTTTVIEYLPATCDTYGPPKPDRTPAPGPPEKRRRGARGAPPVVSPQRLSFYSAGWEPVAIMNPHRAPLRIRGITIRGAAKQQFDIIGAAQCIGRLRPGEHCRFSVFGRPDACGGDQVRIEIHHDASPNPLVILAATEDRCASQSHISPPAPKRAPSSKRS